MHLDTELQTLRRHGRVVRPRDVLNLEPVRGPDADLRKKRNVFVRFLSSYVLCGRLYLFPVEVFLEIDHVQLDKLERAVRIELQVRLSGSRLDTHVPQVSIHQSNNAHTAHRCYATVAAHGRCNEWLT